MGCWYQEGIWQDIYEKAIRAMESATKCDCVPWNYKHEPLSRVLPAQICIQNAGLGRTDQIQEWKLPNVLPERAISVITAAQQFIAITERRVGVVDY